MKLSIIIPVYNEEKTIREVLSKIASVKLPCEKEIIVVDDGSSDGTGNRIKKQYKGSDLKGAKGLTLIIHQKNQGKGAAIRSGIKKATGDYILIQDADLEYNPLEIPKMLTPILINSRPTKFKLQQDFSRFAVYGSRFKKNTAVIPLLYLLGNKFLTNLTNLLYGTCLTDMETCYKLLPAKFMKKAHLRNNGFDVEPEITTKLVKSGIKIIEVPISYKGRSHLSGKKLTIRDAYGAIRALFAGLYS